jgi:hypothetical protein
MSIPELSVNEVKKAILKIDNADFKKLTAT